MERQNIHFGFQERTVVPEHVPCTIVHETVPILDQHERIVLPIWQPQAA